MSLSLPLRLGAVSLGYPRISLVALVGPSATAWTSAEWEQVRETGVSLILAPVDLPMASIPVLPMAQVFLGSEPNGPGLVFLDDRLQLTRYPQWSTTLNIPWGPLLEPEFVVPLAQASVAAGASLVAIKLNQPNELGLLFHELKSLSVTLGRELTRVPKRPEHTADLGPALGPDSLQGSRVAFQGEHGAFSEMAVFSLFSPETSSAIPYPSFRDVFSAVLGGDVDFGMIPIENALAGPINDNYDLLLEFPDLQIVGETQVRVEHNLIGLPGSSLSEIKRVFSHPQGLAQSKVFLDSHSSWEAVPFYDTAGSVKHIARVGDRSLAAIASSEAARVYGMEILVPGVETNHRNFTRFFLIARTDVLAGTRATKVSLVFGTANTPGALSRCLAVFAKHEVNMTKLESRPIHGRPWDYMFYVDAWLPENSGAFDATVQELSLVSKDLRILGRYVGLSS